MIDRTVVDYVLDTANSRIVEVVSDFVSLRKRGANYVGCCPFHNEKTGSFTVSPAKGIFKCFGCGKAGNALNFVMEQEHLTFVEAVKYLGNKFNIEVVDKAMTPEQEQLRSDRESMMAVTDYAARFFERSLWETDEGQSVGLGYFRSRGFRDDIIRLFGLGYSPSRRDALTADALAHSFKLEFLEKTGVTIVSEKDRHCTDRFFGRVIFPIHNLSGKVVAFGGRVMQKSAKTAKYLNSPESELYHKSGIVYGIYHAKAEIVRRDRCFLVEGYTDVISMHQAGIDNVVASSGTSLTQGQIQLIRRFTQNMTVLYDGDSAGIKASLRGINMILAEGMNVKVVLLPDGEDPDSFAQSHTSEDFLQFITDHETDFIKFKAELLMKDAADDPIGRARFIQDVVDTIAVIPNEIMRTVYVRECSRMMDVDEAVLYSALGKSIRHAADEAQRRRHHQPDGQSESPGRPATADAAPAGPTPQEPQPPASPDEPAVRPEVLSPARLDNPYEYEEREVLRLLVRYCDRTFFDHGEGTDVAVGDYICAALGSEPSVNPVYVRMFDAFREARSQSDQLPATRLFTGNADPQLSELACQLVAERYELSRIHSKFAQIVDEETMLDEVVPHAVGELQLRKVRNILEERRRTLLEKERQSAADEEIAALMKDIMHWESVKKKLSSMLGGRTIV